MQGYLRTLDGQEYSYGEEPSSIECFRCGICCTGYYPEVSDEELELIAERLSLSTDEFISRYVAVTQVGYLIHQTENGCVFLTWDKDTSRAACDIYPSRPTACRNLIPSLSRRQCREGLAKLKIDNRILLVSDIYENQEQLERFYTLLTQTPKR